MENDLISRSDAMKSYGKHISNGVWKICAGMIEAEQILPPRYRLAIREAEKEIGKNYSPDAIYSRTLLIRAVKLNLMSRKDYPFELLRRQYLLPTGINAFGREKYNFCAALAKELGLL